MSSLLGGGLIGFAAALLYLVDGRILGASGIAGRVWDGDGFRPAFLAGLLAGAVGFALLKPEVFGAPHWAPMGTLAIAGVFVGVGTQLANGCTSGHGVCGVARGSTRSITATLVFMAVAMTVVQL